MGFYINEFTYELKQHLNLSEQAWEIIYNDMRDFYGEEKKQSFSGFLNRIFYNFYQDAEGSIDVRSHKKREELLDLAKKNEKVFSDPSATEKIISLLVREYEKELIEKASSYSKGIGKKFRVNRQNIEILRESDASSFYNDSIGAYMKAVLEEYVTLPTAKRESIFFKDVLDVCNMAISQRNKLKLSLQHKISAKTSELYTRKFYVSPYAIVTDKNKLFNYLVGISEEITNDGEVLEKRISSFRISRIEKCAVMHSMSGFLSQQRIDEIQKELQKKSPQYMSGDVTDIEISFTKKGLEMLERHLYLRPSSYKKLDDSRYVFHCTELQAIHYFFKFGRDALVISPDRLHKKLKRYYKDALDSYEQFDEENR